MKRIPKEVVIVAIAQLVCFWVIYGLFRASVQPPTLAQFFGFSPPPPPPAWDNFLWSSFITLAAPAGLLMDGVPFREGFRLTMVFACSLLNGVIWGVVLG